MNYDFEVVARRATLPWQTIFSARRCKTIKRKSSNVVHMQAYIISTCVSVYECVCIHRISFMTHPPPKLELMSCDRRSSAGIHNDACHLASNLLHLHMAAFPRPQSAWELTPSQGYLTTLYCCCYLCLVLLLLLRFLLLFTCLQQVHLNIQFQCAFCAHSQSPFQASFSSSYTSSSSYSALSIIHIYRLRVFFLFFKRINTRARTKNA